MKSKVHIESSPNKLIENQRGCQKNVHHFIHKTL